MRLGEGVGREGGGVAGSPPIEMAAKRRRRDGGGVSGDELGGRSGASRKAAAGAEPVGPSDLEIEHLVAHAQYCLAVQSGPSAIQYLGEPWLRLSAHLVIPTCPIHPSARPLTVKTPQSAYKALKFRV